MTAYRISGEQKANNYRRGLVIAGAAAAAFAAVAIAPATASAMPTGGGSAVETINELQARGYHVQLNKNNTAPLSQCSVTDVHGLSGTNFDSKGHRINSGQFDTVHVNVSCQPQD
ncbi:hypothetical protein EB75_00635 [Mycobacterium sp. ST-F2]|uniref:hypothetical protein n=1 Tax=Mycobacterium sp. ST-F2 TaxID=1490484 RepID=UPI000965AEC9|nr:hypothetical protein [Mycobacterium sp. ST-F2]OKH85105.1 hypothetical protein EB75_00635 [Mycobacterium sp. ST-F2]